MSIEKLHKEMREHPERFDYGDLPSGELTDAQRKQAEQVRPVWIKELLAKQAAKK